MSSWLSLLVVGLSLVLLGVIATLLALLLRVLAVARRRPSRVTWRRVLLAPLTAAVGVALARAALAWSHSSPTLAAIDLAALTIPRDRSLARSPDPRWTILAGDLHCHVFPWDGRQHVSRDLDHTIELARAEGIDFAVVVPHLWWIHWSAPSFVDHYRALHRDLRATLAARSSRELVLIPGAEYTDDTGGHTGLAFGNMDAALDAFTHRHDRSDFFRAYASTGGLVTIHHPFLQPIPSRIPQAGDISWRPFTAPLAPVDPSITTLDRLASQVEVFNLGVSEMRDRFILDDDDASLRRTFAQLDREVVRRHRRLTATGGTDSHGSYLRASIFVLAERHDAAAIRDALTAGRTCVRSRAACTLQASADGRNFGPPGSAYEGVTALYLRAQGARIEIIRDGVTVARPASEVVARVEVPAGRCSVLRARVDAGWSGAVYANCGL